MDSFFIFFTSYPEPEIAPEPSIPVDYDGGTGGMGCIVA
jgi:hypothetical protein